MNKAIEIIFLILSLFPSSSLPDVLCDLTDLIWRKGTPFETMTGRTTPLSYGLLPEVFRGFPQPQGKYHEIRAQPPGIISLSHLSLATDVTDTTTRGK